MLGSSRGHGREPGRKALIGSQGDAGRRLVARRAGAPADVQLRPRGLVQPQRRADVDVPMLQLSAPSGGRVPRARRTPSTGCARPISRTRSICAASAPIVRRCWPPRNERHRRDPIDPGRVYVSSSRRSGLTTPHASSADTPAPLQPGGVHQLLTGRSAYQDIWQSLRWLSAGRRNSCAAAENNRCPAEPSAFQPAVLRPFAPSSGAILALLAEATATLDFARELKGR